MSNQESIRQQKGQPSWLAPMRGNVELRLNCGPDSMGCGQGFPGIA